MFELVRRALRLKPHRSKSFRRIALSIAIAVWSLVLGWGMAFALNAPSQSQDNASGLKSIDTPTNRYRVAQELYLENCSTCHLAIPPGVMPTETWKKLLEKPTDHYGQSLNNLIRITQVSIWQYLSAFSRPLSTDEPIPLYVGQSRYFKALHPRVQFPEPPSHKTCISCHPGAKQYDYRSLTPQWENSP